jgi:hypothetical protein
MAKGMAFGKDDIFDTNMEIRTDDTETIPEPEEDMVTHHAGLDVRNTDFSRMDVRTGGRMV